MGRTWQVATWQVTPSRCVERASRPSASRPAEGVGPFPTLAWQSVPDAHRYHVSVIDGDGRAMWAWTTSDTQVVLGGFDEPPPEHVRGPRLHAPMHWHVLARDADERVIAQSGLRPIAP